jgi:hypothetical protein
MTSRLGVPVLDFPLPLTGQDRALSAALDALRASIGRVIALVDIPLFYWQVPSNVLLDETDGADGYNLTAATVSGTVIPGATTAVDTADAWLDQVRVVVYGKANTVNATVQVYDNTNSVVLCTLTLTTTLGLQTGEWSVITPKAGDRELRLRVIGDGVNTQTLYSAHVQFRTLRFTP